MRVADGEGEGHFPPRDSGEGDREAVEGPARGSAAVAGAHRAAGSGAGVSPQPAAAAPSARTSSAPLPRERGRKRWCSRVVEEGRVPLVRVPGEKGRRGGSPQEFGVCLPEHTSGFRTLVQPGATAVATTSCEGVLSWNNVHLRSIQLSQLSSFRGDRICMSDLKLFRLLADRVAEIHGKAAALEKSLQALIERNLETFLGVRFLASEFSTGREHGGRMDTLGIDENGCPVIIEYKRATNANVINQGLFYLDWLVTHRGDFEMLVLKNLGAEPAQAVEWSAPRLICIAGDFSKYDEHAIKQMNHNIELIRYMRFGDDLLMLEQVNAVSAPTNGAAAAQVMSAGPSGSRAGDKTVSDYLAQADQELTDRFDALKEYLTNLGDDVQVKALKKYFAFKRIKNFACVEVHTRTRNLLVYVKVDPDTIQLEQGFTRDVRKIGHFGTGDLEIVISSAADFERAKALLDLSYENG